MLWAMPGSTRDIWSNGAVGNARINYNSSETVQWWCGQSRDQLGIYGPVVLWAMPGSIITRARQFSGAVDKAGIN